MNLADIRKKAQEKTVTGAPPVARDERDVLPPAPAVPAAPAEEVRQETSVFDELFVPAEPRRTPPALPVQACHDPLEVILAGRERAGCDDAETQTATEASQRESGEFQELLCFRVAEEIYAVNIMDIKEIIKPREVTEVPRVPSFVSGVLSLRGIIIPVFDMRRRLGFPSGGTQPKARVIVVKKGEEFCGMVVDEVVQVVRIVARSIEHPPAVLEGIDREFVQGIGRHDGRMLILLSMEKVLDIALN